jgi:hypothetical protein
MDISTAQGLRDLNSRLGAIRGYHGRALTDTQWQGISGTGFTPSGSLTYLTSDEFAQCLSLSILAVYVQARTSKNLAAIIEAPTS